MKKVNVIVLLSVVLSMLLTGCYLNQNVEQNQIGVQMDKNAIKQVVPAGLYTDMGFFSDLMVLDADTLTFKISDPEVLTSDNQAVGIDVAIQARRRSDSDSVKNMLTNWATLTNNDNLITVVSATAREGMKNGARGFTLSTLLNDRNGLADSMKSQIQIDADKYSVEIVNVTIENVAPSSEYMAVLNQKALLKVEQEKLIQEQENIKQKALNDVLQAENDKRVKEQQLSVQKAQTDIDVEIASREGKKIAEQNKIYTTNKEAFELKRLELLKGVIGTGTVYFLPVGTDLTTIFGADGKILPVATNKE